MKQTQLFYNTIGLKGESLAAAGLQCSVQEARIIEIMFMRALAMTPFEVLKIYETMYPVVPVTSIRRAMTSLAKQGILEKTGEMKLEQFGKPNHTWKLVRERLKVA